MKANDEIKFNRKYKDALFRFIFGAEENKEYLLSLYNAVNNSNYTNTDDIKITTLEDFIYIKHKNDISFLIGSQLNLYEHQSTYNPNMPLRGLLYFADLFKQFLADEKCDLYSSTIVKIPTPVYIVFYNGSRQTDDKTELKLSDSFEYAVPGGKYEWTATMLNINIGHNKEIFDKCKPLYEYASFIENVRQNNKKMGLRDAIDKAVNDAIKLNYLDGFFKIHKESVMNMIFTEYNEEEFIENRRKEGKQITLINLVKKGLLNIKDAAEELDTSEVEFMKLMQ